MQQDKTSFGDGSGDLTDHTWVLRLKFVLFSLVLAFGVLTFAEIAIRFSGLDRESMRVTLVPLMDADFRSVHRNDPLLFYSLKPNINGRFNMVTVSTNSLGLRSPEIGPKHANEFRILSLGESTAFGAGVEFEDTYAAQLEKRLNAVSRGEKYSVINAAVSAYSSFQSRVYLEQRGLQLKPDMVLIYHELSDFLPTTNREMLAPDRLGLPMTDKQLFESRGQTINRRLLDVSALYRMLSRLSTEYRVRQFQRTASEVTAGHIHIPPGLETVSTPEGMRKLNLPPRVPLADRRENLEAILAMCESVGAQLVVLHPSYAESNRHECDLTEFCRERGVPMFDVYDCLHPAGAAPGSRYWDLWHPNAEGHACIGASLFDFLIAQKLVPTAKSAAAP